MSEPIFPAPTATMTAPAPAEPEVDAPSGGNRKALLALAGVGALLVAGAGAFFLLSSGGGDEVEAPIVAPPKASAAAKPGTTAKPAKPTVVVKPSTVVVAARDPFKPLFPEPKAETPATTDGTGATPAPSASASASTPVTDPAVVLAVTAIKPETQSATISVDGKKYKTVVGEEFGKFYVMYSVFNEQCVGVLMGDQSVAVCSGKSVTITP